MPPPPRKIKRPSDIKCVACGKNEGQHVKYDGDWWCWECSRYNGERGVPITVNVKCQGCGAERAIASGYNAYGVTAKDKIRSLHQIGWQPYPKILCRECVEMNQDEMNFHNKP